MNLFEEELDPKNLAIRATKAEEIINITIQKLENDMFSQKEKTMNDWFPNQLNSLVIDFWELKNAASKVPLGNEKYIIAKKVINLWNDKFYKSLNKLDAKILEWNRRHKSNQLPRIEQICKVPIREEINYFSY